jgi:hypothetical protein
MFGYQILGRRLHKFQPLLFCPKEKKEPSLMSDLIMGTDCRFITDVSRDLLGYFNNPTGDQQVYGTKRGFGDQK